MKEKDIDYTLLRRNKIFSWACRRASTELAKRVDDLLVQIGSPRITPLKKDLAKEEATELAKILKRRGARK